MRPTAEQLIEGLKQRGLQVKVIERDQFGGLAVLPYEDLSTTVEAQREVFISVALGMGLRVTSKNIVFKANGLEPYQKKAN